MKLNQKQRFFVSLIYIVLITLIFSSFGGKISEIVDNTTNIGIWFCTGALLIIFGVFITEPFFSKPADTLTSSITVILALLALPNKKTLIGYWIILSLALFMLALSILTITLKDTQNWFLRIIHFIVMNFGSAKFIFSPFYLLSAYSFYAINNQISAFCLILTLWIFLCFSDPITWLVQKSKSLNRILKSPSFPLGIISKSKTEDIFIITVDNPSMQYKLGSIVAIQKKSDKYCLGVITGVNHTQSITYCDVYLIRPDLENELFSTEELNITPKNSRDIDIFYAYIIDINNCALHVKQMVDQNYLLKNINSFIGHILPNSNIDTIFFTISNSKLNITEGLIVHTRIYNESVYYQIVNGTVAEQRIDVNSQDGFLFCTARKLGKFKEHTIESGKWVPNASEPVFLYPAVQLSDDQLKVIAKTAVGFFPQTDFSIPLQSINELITHNTAILGILGVGKSCLALEIITKVIQAGVKVICIDITNQYSTTSGLSSYIDSARIVNGLSAQDITTLSSTSKKSGYSDQYSTWGNIKSFGNIIDSTITTFLDSENSVFVINPDDCDVGKAATQFKITETVEVTLAEKTRIICESVLDFYMKKGASETARCLIVFEEAHSIIPEWNSVSCEGDKTAVNGTAKVIMQSRKYGMGCLVVTQRTANVTKSILSQCNTVFALRIFDDTGKTFLENYVGSQYANLLPTLDERHAVAIGRGLALKQPVIMQLNDRKHVMR